MYMIERNSPFHLTALPYQIRALPYQIRIRYVSDTGRAGVTKCIEQEIATQGNVLNNLLNELKT